LLLTEIKYLCEFDNRTTQNQVSFAEWELKGVPVRIAVGPKI
jgi:prolyl-tRNA synthetase